MGSIYIKIKQLTKHNNVFHLYVDGKVLLCLASLFLFPLYVNNNMLLCLVSCFQVQGQVLVSTELPLHAGDCVRHSRAKLLHKGK